MVRKICVVTGSRAEYGLLRLVIQQINESPHLELHLVVTGAHLSPEFGMTVSEIEADGFKIDHRTEMLLSSDTSIAVSKSLGLGVIGFADVLGESRPDILLILGDRYEIFAAATAAMIARIPIAHIHGGEVTEGSVDEAIRHAISKMSHLHFVAAEEYRDRLIQMGEQPVRVFNVGGLGVEAVKRTPRMSRQELESFLGLALMDPVFLVTYHPVTLDPPASVVDFVEMLEAFKLMRDVQFIFTMPNADSDGRVIAQMIKAFCTQHPRSSFFQSIGQVAYISLMAEVSGVVGNSSSGLLEAPAAGVGTINIGSRQDGRLKASSVISVEGDRKTIHAALETLLTGDFISSLRDVQNPYGVGNSSEAIVRILETTENYPELLRKRFYDSGVK